MGPRHCPVQGRAGRVARVRVRDVAETRRNMEKDTLKTEPGPLPAPSIEIRPSNLRRRYLCPGSGRMEAGLPDEDSPLAREGRLLHSYWANPEYDRGFLLPQQRDILRTAD